KYDHSRMKFRLQRRMKNMIASSKPERERGCCPLERLVRRRIVSITLSYLLQLMSRSLVDDI
ncbi:MAG TPA: hypothetical protein VLH08_21710, partial [Acidobacteriota bacterium]|nr:hypothetical protein [Acidobacteriota bacterium]